MYIRNIYKVKNVNIQSCDFNYVSLDVLNIKNLNSLSVIGFYRPPKSSNVNKFLQSIESMLTKSAEMCLFCGDINIDIKKTTINAINYNNLIQSCGFQICNNVYSTRDAAETIIDHLASNFSTKYKHSVETIGCDFSDHNIIMTSIETKARQISNTIVRNIIDYETLQDSLRERFRFDKPDTDDVDVFYDFISVSITSALQFATKSKVINMKKIKHCDWLNSCPNIVALIKQKNNLVKKKQNKIKIWCVRQIGEEKNC